MKPTIVNPESANLYVGAVEKVCRMHQPQRRFHLDDEGSFATLEDFAEYHDVSLAEAEYLAKYFDVCRECGRTEMSADQVADCERDYLESMWPCRTEQTLRDLGIFTDAIRRQAATADEVSR